MSKPVIEESKYIPIEEQKNNRLYISSSSGLLLGAYIKRNRQPFEGTVYFGVSNCFLIWEGVA